MRTKTFFIVLTAIALAGIFSFGKNAKAQALPSDCLNWEEDLKNKQTCDSAASEMLKLKWIDAAGKCCRLKVTTITSGTGETIDISKTPEEKLTETQQDWRKKYPGLYTSSQPALERGLNLDWPNSPITNVNLKQLEKGKELTGLVRYLYGWGISLGGLAAFIALVIAGFQYLTSAGNAQKMSDAISRIRSAAIGLVLLLASVLILNTINPQLTTLRMPPFTIGTEQISTSTIAIEEMTLSDCKGAILYSGVNFGGVPVKQLASGGTWKVSEASEAVDVGSVDIEGKGLCELKLYQRSNFTEDADRPATTISGDIRDVAAISGTTKFRSGKLINLFYPEMLKNQ